MCDISTIIQICLINESNNSTIVKVLIDCICTYTCKYVLAMYIVI